MASQLRRWSSVVVELGAGVIRPDLRGCQVLTRGRCGWADLALELRE
jgi:hypothetical protein